MTKPTKPVAPVAPTPKAAPKPISHNSAFLEWPTDVWGLTKDIKRALVDVASRLNGHEDKKALLDATLAVALGHVEAKYAHDAELRTARIKEAELESNPEANPDEPQLF